MRKTKRSAFTIVELVIVIAVIAILSAVLIPTFGAIIKNANVASDQATAATLTSELHVYLKGETIDSEEELMDVLSDAKSGIGKKLVPKAAAYGNHFWFDMANQMIIADSYEGIQERNGSTASIESRVQLMSLTRSASNDINVSFREIAREGYFFIDYNGSSIAKLFNEIDASVDAEDYNKAISTLSSLVDTSANEDATFAQKLIDTIGASAVIAENFVIVPSGATYVYFEPNIKFVNNNGSLEGISSGSTITLPSSVIAVATGALNFGSSDIILDTSCRDAVDVEKIFANASTNATIKTAIESYKIADGEGNVTIVETADKLANKLVIVNEIANNKATPIPNITLSGKLPYEDFTLSLKDDKGNGGIAFVDNGENKGAYINYGVYAGTGEKIQIYLNPTGGTQAKASSDLITWNYPEEFVTVEGGVATISADADEPFTITASVRVVSGEKVERSFTVHINKVNKATVSAGSASVSVEESKTTAFTWNYIGTTGIEFSATSIAANYRYPYATCNNTPVVNLSVENNNYFSTDGDVLNLILDEIGVPEANGETVPVTVKLDNCLTATINVKVVDNDAAIYQPNFRWYSSLADENGEIRRYYVGNGTPVKLSDILTGTFEESTLTINGYAVSGLSYPINSETYEDELSVEINNTKIDSLLISESSVWNTTTLKFTGSSSHPIIMEVRPTDAEKVPSVIEIVIVDAVNAYTASEVTTALNAGKSVVLLSDLTGDASITSNAVKFEIGSNKFYGNGHKITVTDAYVARTENNNYLTGEYFMSLGEKGLVENVYIDGPVYTKVQYNDSAMDSTPDNNTYVSGILVTGEATISNSYVSGFRSPVQVNCSGDKEVTLKNVTLDGGNLCNLSLMDGDLVLDDVTTIQVPTTVGDTAVLGAGILVEHNGLDSDITIKGNFMQYNWHTEEQAKSLPEVKVYDLSVKLGDLLPAAFGIDKTAVIMKEVDEVKYINTGIVYMAAEKKVNGTGTYTIDDLTGDIYYENANITGLTSISSSLDEVLDAVNEKGEYHSALAKKYSNPFGGSFDLGKAALETAKALVFTLAGGIMDALIGDLNVVFSVNTYGSTVTNPPVAPGNTYSGYYTTHYSN